MNFHDVRFPASISYGSTGGPERRTEIVTLANGYEERNSPWADSRRHYDAGMGMHSLDDLAEVLAFFEARHGQLYGFRWKDWLDFKSGLPSGDVNVPTQVIGLGDGSTTEFQLCKTYVSGAQSYKREISKPVLGSVTVAVDGMVTNDFGVDDTTGILSLNLAPENGAEVMAGFEFDVPVRFDMDRIEASVATFNAGEIPNIPVVEVRV